jgi:alkanesulfonate monooxygenase SsuD/methylene tetrahydromethanopterin reductase-like flavin-dependent oxidoreductase (luciferase family)
MRCAIDVCPLGELADPASIVRLAVAAEAAGWDGLSIWDSLGTSMGTAAADPLVTLAAVASATSRLRLITSVLALPRRRPQLVAQAAATLDRLSGGRLTLGLGAGGDPGDFEPFGESFAPARRLAELDEGLALVDAYLRSDGALTAQRPRPPIWIGGMKPGILRRAARWDGWIAVGVSDDGSSMNLSAPELTEMIARIATERASAGRDMSGFDVAVFGMSEAGDAGRIADFGRAGASWWLESLSPLRGGPEQLLARISAGPAGGQPVQPSSPTS